MYINSWDSSEKPTRCVQRMIKDAAAERVSVIAARKGWDKEALQHILFTQGFGRKSANLIMNKIPN